MTGQRPHWSRRGSARQSLFALSGSAVASTVFEGDTNFAIDKLTWIFREQVLQIELARIHSHATLR